MYYNIVDLLLHVLQQSRSTVTCITTKYDTCYLLNIRAEHCRSSKSVV